jgi:hypothetical protein
LFVQLRYPFSSQPIINGQPDFILPSVDNFACMPLIASYSR